MQRKVRSRAAATAAAAAAAAAAEKVADNIHMLWEILIRVPLKPLVRLKCVSKRWQALISDQQFSDSHSLHHQQHQRYPNSLIFSNGGLSYILPFTTTTTTPTLRVLNFNFLNQLTVTVVRSCNGLLLCAGYDMNYFVCNPITRDFTTFNLARHPCIHKSNNIQLYLAFNPSMSPRYKVVSVAQSLNSRLDWVFHVYTFKTRSRIGSGVSVSIPFALNAAKGVYCNGAIHWCNEGGEFSVYFDVDTQRLKNYPMPPFVSKSKTPVIEYFGESGGCLHLMVAVEQTLTKGVYDLFELNQDYSGWSLRHRVDFKPLLRQLAENRFPNDLRVQIVRTAKAKDKKVKSSMLVLIVGYKGAVFYDPVDKTLRKLCDFDMVASVSVYLCISRWGNVLQHFESLVQPKDANRLN